MSEILGFCGSITLPVQVVTVIAYGLFSWNITNILSLMRWCFAIILNWNPTYVRFTTLLYCGGKLLPLCGNFFFPHENIRCGFQCGKFSVPQQMFSWRKKKIPAFFQKQCLLPFFFFLFFRSYPVLGLGLWYFLFLLFSSVHFTLWISCWLS